MNMQVTANGNSFECRLDGREGAPWIVFSNSLATDMSMWDGEVAKLEGDFRILRYDTRGHGGSAASEGPYDFDLLVADVVALMDHFEIGKAHYVGLSLGGMTGLGLAIAHPDRVASLAACDARAFAEPEWAAAWPGRIEVVRKGGMEALVEPTIARWFTPDFQADPANAAALDRVRAMIRATSDTGYIGCASALAGLDFRAGLGKIDAPALFMTGASDGSTPPDASREMQAAVPGSACVIVDPASHISNIENPEQFDRALLDHLARAA